MSQNMPLASLRRIVAAVFCAAASSAALLVQLDAVGDGVRVRLVPAGGAIVEPPYSAFAPNATSVRRVGPSAPPVSLSNGNVHVDVDSTGHISATRGSDGAELLSSTALTWGAAANGSRPGSVSALLSIAPHSNELAWGFGQHSTGRVALPAFFRRFEDSQNYTLSHGSDSSIPWYASSAGFGFLWNSPGYGYVDFGPSGTTWFANATQNVDFWVVTTPPAETGTSTGAMLKALLARYVDVVGHAPPMPAYATGFIQSKNRYRNQASHSFGGVGAHLCVDWRRRALAESTPRCCARLRRSRPPHLHHRCRQLLPNARVRGLFV